MVQWKEEDLPKAESTMWTGFNNVKLQSTNFLTGSHGVAGTTCFLLSSGLYISQTFTNSFLIVVGFAVCDTKTGSVLRCIQTHTEHLSNQKNPANPMVIAAAVPSRSIGQVELWAGQPWPLKSMWILTVLKLDIFKTFQDCRLHLLIGFACRCLISRGMVARLRSSSAEKASCEAITHLLKKIFPKVAWCITKWWKMTARQTEGVHRRKLMLEVQS